MGEPNTTWEELDRGVDRPAGERHTFVLERKKVTIIEVDDLSFHFNSAVLLPEAQIVEAGATTTRSVFGLATIASALRHAESEGGHALVAGHTDSVGSEAVNLVVSQHRASNVLAYLKGDRSGWIRACERHVMRDVQAILAFIDRRFGFGCDPGGIDGKWGPRSREALRVFRRRFKDEGGDVPLSGPIGNKDWGAFFDMYERGLAAHLGVEVSALSGKRGALQLLDPPTLGCGESWPVDGKHRDDVRSASNRRVEIMFFEDTDVPAFASEVPPGRSLYENERRFQRRYVDVEGDVIPFALKVLADGEPLADADYELIIEGQTIQGNTGGGAMVETNVPRNARVAQLKLQGGAIVFNLRLTEGLSDAEELRGVQRRLQNLAYYSGPLHGEQDELTTRALRAFQHDRGLNVTGEPDGATKAELQSMFGS